jgi:hypothetical protein
MTAKWKKIEAGHYVHTTGDGYTATVFLNKPAGPNTVKKYWQWHVVVTTPAGEVWWDSVYRDMKTCRYNALRSLNHDPMFSYYGVPYPNAAGTPMVRTCSPELLSIHPKAMLGFVRGAA